MAAKVVHKAKEYFGKNSPEKHDVVQCLKNTRKGRLSYGSNLSWRIGADSGAGRTVRIDGDRLIVSLSSPPDQRNHESFGIVKNATESVSENKLADKKLETLATKQDKRQDFSVAKQCDRSSLKPVEKDEIKVSCGNLCVSSSDVLDLLKECKIELEEKEKTKVITMKGDFLTGLDATQNDLKVATKHDDATLRAKYISDLNELEKTLMEAETSNEEDMKKLLIHYNRRQNIVLKRNEEIAKRQEEIQHEKRLQEVARQKILAQCKSIESALIVIRDLCTETLKELEAQKTNTHLPDSCKSLTSDIKQFYANAANIAKDAVNHQKNLEEALEFMQKTVDSLELTKEKVLQEIAKAETKAKEEEERKELEKKAADAKALEEKRIEDEKRKMQDAKTFALKQESAALKISSLSKGMEVFVSQSAFEHYQEILKFHEQLTTSFTQFIATKEKKPFRFELTKVINTPINAISDQSPQHLMDKIERLTKLLKGDTIEHGGKMISAASDPLGLAYSQDTVSKKLVLQGAKQISSSFNSAFAFGAVALGIWSQFPEVGKLILAHFYLACPYLVPYYMPKKEGQSTAEYCKCLGYEVDGEDVESEDKYLKKLSGVVRLYAAILQSPMPPSLSSLAHPFGIHNGWSWLSRIINLEPIETVTATVLFDFLDVAGCALSKSYGKQFQKLLQLLCQEMVPKIDQITQPDNKGPVVRLKLFLEKCLKSNIFPVPDGHISSRWWRSNGGSF